MGAPPFLNNYYGRYQLHGGAKLYLSIEMHICILFFLCSRTETFQKEKEDAKRLCGLWLSGLMPAVSYIGGLDSADRSPGLHRGASKCGGLEICCTRRGILAQ